MGLIAAGGALGEDMGLADVVWRGGAWGAPGGLLVVMMMLFLVVVIVTYFTISKLACVAHFNR